MKLYNSLKSLILEIASVDSVTDSIKKRQVVSIYYTGDEPGGKGLRIIEPVCLGYSKAGNLVLRAWDTDGASHTAHLGEQPKPSWRLFRLDKIVMYKPTGETFDEQIEALQNIVGHRIQFSKIREIILGDKEEIPVVNHRKFDAFKNSIRYADSDRHVTLTKEQRSQLYTDSERMKEVKEDFYLDAFWVFGAYMRLFNRQDSHVIKNETDRIMKITQLAVRNNVLEALGI